MANCLTLRRLSAIAVCALGVSVVLPGCAAPDSGAAGQEVAALHRATIEEILSGDPTDLERSVLEDFNVSDAELASAEDAYRDCMSSHGLEGTVGEGKLLVGATEESQDSFASARDDRTAALDEIATITQDCTDKNLATIGSLYYSMKSNPDGISFEDAVRECFAERGIGDGAGLSDAEFGEMILGKGGGGYTPSPEAQECIGEPFAQ